MRRHAPHPVLAAALAVALCAALAPVWGQTTPATPSPPSPHTPSVHADAAGNLHVTTAPNQTVLINGVDFVGELDALQAALAALSRTTTTTTRAPTTTTPKVFSSASQTRLVGSDTAADDRFGRAVGVSGTTIVVGAHLDDHSRTEAGAAYVFAHNGSAWVQQQKLVASDAATGSRVGRSVAISGGTIVVGAYYEDHAGSNSGAAYIYTLANGAWVQQQKLTASDARAVDEFGVSVALDGNTIVVGAHFNDDAGTSSGSAYVYQRSGATWTEQQKLVAQDAAADDRFGAVVGISGGTIVVGAHLNDDGSTNSGSAYVFTRSGTAWVQQQKLTASDAATQDYFGFSVAISGNTIAVGAHLDDDGGSSSGSVYVFTRTGTAWAQQQKLVATDAAANDNFGTAVALDGHTLVVGALYNDDGGSNTGSAYVFTLSGGTWAQQAKLTAADAATGDTLGIDVAVSGATAVVGARLSDAAGRDSGAAYVF